MKNNPGFSLLELMIALLIGAMIISGLFATLYQVGRAQHSISMVTDANQQAAIIFNHLERDIMGAFIPEQVEPIQSKKQEEDTQAQQAKPIEKVFWGKARDDKNLQLLTFITSNPLEPYLGVKNTKPKTRVARVVYRLDPQKGFKDSFVLSRQEGADLSYAVYKKQADKKKVPVRYDMVDNIAALSISYLVPDAEKKVNDDEQKREYKKTKNWNSDSKNEKDKDKGIQYTLPEFLQISLELWDTAHEKKFNFSYTIPVLFKKGKPKRKQQSPPQKPPMQIAQKTKKSSPAVFASAANGEKVTITKDADGKIVLTQVPA